MTRLSDRRTRTVFETGSAIRERGRLRPIVVEAHNSFATLRLKGTRKSFTLTYDAMYSLAAKQEADALRRERAIAKKSKGR